MRWQPGGNLAPFLAACEYDFLDCPFAFVHYVWSEIVTDVADCLANETILWRILVIVLLSATVAHLIYWNLRWLRELQLGKDEIKNIQLMLQDLELKVNILTYKAQYDSWILPRFAKEFTVPPDGRLMKFEDESWIEQMIVKARKGRFDEKSARSRLPASRFTALELKPRYDLLNYEMAAQQAANLDNNKLEPKNDKKNESEDNVESDVTTAVQSKGGDSLSNSKSIVDGNIANDTKSTKRTDNLNTKQKNRNGKTLKFKLNSVHNKSTDEGDNKSQDSDSYITRVREPSTKDMKVKSDTQETLFQVKEKLQNLHWTLRNYNLKESLATESYFNQNLIKSGIDQTDRDFDKQWNRYDNKASLNLKTECTGQHMNSLDYSSYNDIELEQRERRKFRRKMEKSNTFTLINDYARFNRDCNKNTSVISNVDEANNYSEGDKQSILTKNQSFVEPSVATKIIDEESSAAIPIRKTNAADKTALALNLREELPVHAETERNYTRGNIDCNKFPDSASVESRFQPKLFDIKEEPCESNSATANKNKTLKRKAPPYQDRQTNREDSENTSSSPEATEFENETEIKRDAFYDNMQFSEKKDNQKAKRESNFSTDSSSDSSVDRLIDRLIESERKRKFIDESANTQPEKEVKGISLNRIFGSHSFLEPVQFENDERNFSTSINTEKFNLESANDNDNHINDDKKDAQTGAAQSSNQENLSTSSLGTVIENNSSVDLKPGKKEKHVKKESLTFPGDSLKKSILTLDIRPRNFEVKDTNTCLHTVAEPHHRNFNQAQDEDKFSNKNSTQTNFGANNEINEKSDQMSDTKNEDLSAGDKISNNDNAYQMFNFELDLDDVGKMLGKTAENFDNDQQSEEETTHTETLLSSFTNTLLSGDTIDLDAELSSVNKLKNSTLHDSIDNTSSVAKNALIVQKHNSYDSILKSVTKNNLDFDKPLKAKSNSNILENDKKSPTLPCKRSKSYGTTCEPTSLQNDTAENNSKELSLHSVKSTSKSSTSQELDNESEMFEESQGTSQDSFNKLEKSVNSDGNSSVESMLSNTLSKSCAPKNKLKVNNKDDNLKSDLLLQNSLTSTADSCKTVFKNEYKTESESEWFSKSGEDSVMSKTSSETDQEKTDDSDKNTASEFDHSSKQRAIMYVNIMTDNDQIISEVINPEQFLEYIKTREIEIPNGLKEKEFGIVVLNDQTVICQQNLDVQRFPADDANIKNEHSIITLETQNVSLKLSPVKVETEVLVKPSTKETSTSVSDLVSAKNNTDEKNSNDSKTFEIPEELMAEEYIKLLQIANKSPTF